MEKEKQECGVEMGEEDGWFERSEGGGRKLGGYIIFPGGWAAGWCASSAIFISADVPYLSHTYNIGSFPAYLASTCSS